MRFNKSRYHKILVKSAAVAEALTPEMHAYILSLLPTPQSYRELHNRLQANYSAGLHIPLEKAKEREADCEALGRELSILYGLARTVALKDPTVPKTLGLHDRPEKTAVRAKTILTAPRKFKVFHAPDGRLLASCARSVGAKSYEIWATDGNPCDEANWRLIASSSHCKNIPIIGLDRTKGNWLRACAKRGNVSGPWSDCFQLLPA